MTTATATSASLPATSLPATSLPLAGRTVLVTGGSRGIGRAVVQAAHRDGATVVLHYGSAAAAAETIAAELGDRVQLVRGDLTAPDGPAAVWAMAISAVGRIDVLVNNAGAWIASPVDDPAVRPTSDKTTPGNSQEAPAGPTASNTQPAPGPGWTDGWVQNLNLNLTAPADLCRAAIQHYRVNGGGIIINVASRSSHRGDDADHLAYGAAKGGLLALTKGIARGFAADNILAYAVAPGWVATDLAAGELDAERVAALPLGEPTPPTDVAEVIVFLASGRARHTTGATIDITGADYVR